MNKLINTIIILIPLCLFAWVAVVFLDADGQTMITWEAGDNSPFVHGLRPTGRVGTIETNSKGDKYHSLAGDPVYLSVTPPGNYETVDARVWIDTLAQPVVKFGATVNATAGQIDLQPLVHQTLDQLDWPQTRKGDLVLYQRDNDYADLDTLLSDPPPLSSIATYRYRLPEDEAIPRAWTARGSTNQDNVSLRGFHEFVTATDGRGFTVDVMYMDMNRSLGEDPVAVRVWQGKELVAEVKGADDGVDTATNASLNRRHLSLDVVGLQSGLVKVELHGGNDIYWREMNTTLPKATYSKNVFVGDEVGYLDAPRPVELWTDAQHITLFTRHAEGVQTVTLGDQKIQVAIPHEHYHIENNQTGVTKLTIPKGDLLVVTDGRIAFSRDTFFNPFPVQLDDRTSLDKLGIDYVIAEYPETEQDGPWTVGEASFWLPPLEREGGDTDEGLATGSYRFVFSLPNIAERDAAVRIHKVEMTFKRPARSIGDIIKRVVHKLRY